jgi:hypothetical protein
MFVNAKIEKLLAYKEGQRRVALEGPSAPGAREEAYGEEAISSSWIWAVALGRFQLLINLGIVILLKTCNIIVIYLNLFYPCVR